MLTRRDIFIALISVCATGIGFSAATTPAPENLGSAVFDWNAMTVNKTSVGEYRQVIKHPIATLDELELHVTTLNPGLSSHAPHQHVNEELVIIREGTVEVLSNDKWVKVGPGSVVFNASSSPHALRNVGSIPAVYHVINWQSAETKRLAKERQGQAK
jgi:XRE family transcriptional regulator, regulator of sulfur utilization